MSRQRLSAKSFDWGEPKRLYWDLDVDPNEPLDTQLDQLKEDLVQAIFADGIVLDVGWYPEFKSDGRFVTLVVRDEDWDEPLFCLESSSIGGVGDAINAALAMIRSRSR